jgi:peroxiredoxin
MREAPSVEEANRIWGDEIDIVGVAGSGDQRTKRAFIDEGGLTFPQIDDTAGEVYGRFGIPYQPAAVLISTDGTWQVTREELNVATIGDLARS